MRARAAAALVAAAALLVSGCGGDDGGNAGRSARDAGVLAPDFGAIGETAETTVTTAGSTAPTTIVIGGPAAVPDAAPSTTASPAAQPESSLADPEGDTTPSPIDRPPAWSDLLGARLTRSDDGFELRVRVAGGDAPEGSGSEGQTMNVASFFDVDGDGEIDYEVWANIADGGWGGSYFDNRDGTADYLDDSGVAIGTDADEVVIAFPHAHLADATTFRWAVASEWGRYEAIGTPAAVRDYVPEDGSAALFPSS